MEEKYSWPGWETVRLIGRGSFGGVYEIRRDVFGHEEKAAMKVITIPQNDSDAEELFDSGYDEQSVTETFRSHLESIVNEYTLMRQMNGAANVVNCDDFRIVEHVGKIGWDIFIKMELLTPLTRAVGREPSEEQVRRIAHDLCSALVLCKKKRHHPPGHQAPEHLRVPERGLQAGGLRHRQDGGEDQRRHQDRHL